MSKKLTIGMAVYDDYDGVFFTVQALKMYHLAELKNEVEIIVVDNNPDSAHGKEIKNFITNWAKEKYIPYTAKKSTSTRNEIFKNAAGKYTLCMDSHVLIEKDGIQALLKYYESNPETNNLVQGPLWYDDLKSYSTHFDPVWRDVMFGVWATNKEKYEKGEPFKIPMMGLGLFSCRTAAWPGFNEHFKGFGGEEGYIHEKFRRNDASCICLPQLKWNHRFGRPNGVPYPNILEDRIWNYFVGWLEILKDPQHEFIQGIVNAFKQKIPEPVIKNILNKAVTALKL
jgi:predicted glycosyltransferase involved in capsule biosynthesis